MILYYERESAIKTRDWLLRMAESTDRAAVAFREQADRMTRDIEECEKREADAIHT